MKRRSKPTLAVLFTLVFALLFSCAAFAAPGGGKTGERVCKSHPGPLITLADVAKTAAVRNNGPMRAPSLQPAVADLPLAVIVVSFSDMPYSGEIDWARSIFRDSYSLAEFYTNMSLGQFTFTPARETSAFGGKNTNAPDAVNDGVIHVSLDLPHDDWTLEYPYKSKKDIATNRTMGEAMCAAIEAADAYIDFAAYDTDESGAITTDELALGFVFAGYEASTSDAYKKGRSLYLWSHAWSLEEMKEDYGFTFDVPTPDGVTVSSYIAISECEENGDEEPYATLAHELGHYIGLPDLYDTSYNTTAEWGKYDVGCLSLMCMDCWEDAETGETIPTPLDAWSRAALGWIEPETADAGVYTLTAQNYADNTGYSALRIDTQNPGEYYLLENRAPSKWDAPLTAEFSTEAGGVVFWHIDDNVYDRYNDDNRVNDADHRPAVMPLFPEKNSGGDYAFIGKNSTVRTIAPFFDRAVWDADLAHLGDAFDLPIYGTGGDADSRAARTLSGVKVAFLTDAGTEMRIMVDPDTHVHNPVIVALREPTCAEPGLAYIECPLCGLRFTDESCAVQTTEPVELPALGHTAPNAAGKCERCGESLIAENELCPYCHQYHGGSFFQRIVAFFHRILYFFAHLFGTM